MTGLLDSTTSRMRSRKLMMITAMILVSIVYLLTYYSGGQGNNLAVAIVDASPLVANRHTFRYVLNKPDLCGNGGSWTPMPKPPPSIPQQGVGNVTGNASWTTTTTSESPSTSSPPPPPSIHTVIMVVTAPSNFVTRQAIRQTWGTVVQNSDYRLAFVMGQPDDAKVQAKVLDEDAAHGDIIQEDFTDTYRNLTLKSIAILKWVDSHCRNSKYVIKIDDDCFLNVAVVRSYLDDGGRRSGGGGSQSTRTIFGRVWQKVKPIRDEKDKWHVTKDEFDGDAFPDYVGGPTYVMTTDAVPELYAAALSISAASPSTDVAVGRRSPFVLEDVFVTGMCADRAKVARVSDTKFGVGDAPTACTARSVISFHRVPPDVMFMLWWLVNDSKLGATCTVAKAKENDSQQCSKSSNVLIDITNLVIKNVHGS